LWFLCLWVKHLGDAISDSKVDAIQAIRTMLRKAQPNDSSFAAWQATEILADQSNLLERLVGLEGQLFPQPRAIGGRLIVNVYNRSKAVSSVVVAADGPIIRWIPGSELRSAVTLFTAKVKSASNLNNGF